MDPREIVLDPVLQEVLRIRGNPFNADLDAMPLEQALREARLAASPGPIPTSTRDITIDADRGTLIRVRLYYPNVPAKGLPLLVHLHGGGFVGGSIELDDLRCGRLALQAECIVGSVDYGLAPEHPFPAAIEDAFTAWTWLTSHAADIGVDHERCAVGGTSAGGHIAIGVTLLARARQARMPVFQLLIYPVVDPAMSTDSYRDFRDGPFMTGARMAWYWKQYGKNGVGRNEHLWAPLTAPPDGLPAAHIVTAEYDVLRDEAEAYAAHLRAAGIPSTVERYPNLTHGFVTMLPDHPASRAALASSVAALRIAFARK